MHILLIHNNYGIYSGEEAVVDKQISLFKEMGHSVTVYRKTTEGFRGTLAGDIKGFIQGFYSPSAIREIKQLLKSNKSTVRIITDLSLKVKKSKPSQIKIPLKLWRRQIFVNSFAVGVNL